MKIEVIDTIKKDKKYYSTGAVLEVSEEEGKNLIQAKAAKAVSENVKAANAKESKESKESKEGKK